MATVINNPSSETDGGGNSFLVGVVVLVLFIGILLYFGIPALRRVDSVQVNAPAPQVNVEAPKVEIPDKINVEVTPTE